MFIREIRKKLTTENGQEYEYLKHRLVESIRTENGPRQHTILNLGTLCIPKEQFKTLANLIEEQITTCRQESFFPDVTDELVGLARHFAEVIIQKRLQHAKRSIGKKEEASPCTSKPAFETVDTNSIITSCSRTIGPEHIALSFLRQLDFFSILDECSFTQRQQEVAAAQLCARMVHPASERETARWLRENSALDELLDTDFSRISDQTLHRTTDMLLAHQEYIEQRLCETTNDLFSLDNKLILYDLTNTYFESPKRGSRIADYGKSKEKRNDCPQITLALIVDGLGFPKRSRIFEGGISEPNTLWELLEMLESTERDTVRPRTIVIDAGIATEENLAKLKADERFEYVAVSRKKKFGVEVFNSPGAEKHTLSMSRGKKLDVTISRYGDETFLLCKSPDRCLKDEAILTKRIKRFESGLHQIKEGLKKPRTRKKYPSVYERIGRLKERYKIGHLYDITVKEQNGLACDIEWTYHSERNREFGEYIIRTTRTDLADGDISLIHRTLTMIESAFRWLKSELGLRPNFHQKDNRMVAHAVMSVFAYFVLAPVLNRLEWGGEFVGTTGEAHNHAPWNEAHGWQGLMRVMSSQTRVTTSFTCQDSSRMDVRTSVEPTAEQLSLYRRLGINPRPLKRVIAKKTGKCSAQKTG